MKKDKEWLKNELLNSRSVNRGMILTIGVVMELVYQLDEPEKIVIPRFVADWWEGDSVTMYGGERINKKYKLRLISNFHDRGLGDYLSKVEDWLDENDSTFLDLVNGKPYEVEEEQKYYVLTSRNKNLLIKDNGEVRETYQVYNWVKKRDKDRYQLTEQEIKDYDERFWPFAVEVEE